MYNYLIQFVLENVMTIQLLGKEDHITDDTITSEEKWSLYVDQFVQLSTAENNSVKRRDPFCKRNLPVQVGEEPPVNVETKSGLELKICVNTYKIFFVDNTEDYFKRKRISAPVEFGNKRVMKFREWLEGGEGWRRETNPEQATLLLETYHNLIQPTTDSQLYE
jgi:paired amphipathic helix protein Sin3a